MPNYLDPLGLAARAATRTPQITPEQEESILGWAGQKALGGLEWLGMTLDKPGAAVRGLLAGQPEALLNLIPFSDAAGLTDPDERVWGRDLLEMYAGAPRNRPGLFNSFEDFAWDVAGLGTEVVTDPLMLVRGPTGALTTKGLEAFRGIKMSESLKTALPQFKARLAQLEKVRGTGKTVGVLDGPQYRRVMGRTVAEKAAEIRSGERALLGLGLPGMAPFATFGKGEWAAKALEKLWYSPLSAVPWARYAFSHKVGGVPAGAAQLAKDAMFSHSAQIADLSLDMMPAMRTKTKELTELFGDLALHSKKQGDDFGFEVLAREAQEYRGKMLQNADGMEVLHKDVLKYLGDPVNTTAADWEKQVGGFSQQLHGYLNANMEILGHGKLTKLVDGELVDVAPAAGLYGMLQRLGVNSKNLDDMFMEGYHPRTASSPAVRKKNAAAAKEYEKLFGHNFPFASPRNQLLREWPGRTAGINKVARDPFITATQGVRNKPAFKAALTDVLESNGLSAENLSVKEMQQLHLWKKYIEPDLKAANLSDDAMMAQRERWTAGEVIGDTELGPRIERAVEYFAGLPEDIKQTGMFDRRMVDDLADYTTHIARSLGTVLSAHHFLAGEKIVWKAGEGLGEGVSLKDVWRKAGFTDEGLHNFAKRKYPGTPDAPGIPGTPGPFDGDLKDVMPALNELMTDSRTQRVLETYVESMRPLNIGRIGEAYDKINSMYKGWLTMAPAFHTRNLVGGLWQWWSEGVMGLGDILGSIGDAAKHVHSGGKKPLQYIDEILDGDILRGSGGTQVAGAAVTEELGTVPRGFLGGVLSPYSDLPPERLAGSKLRIGDVTASRGVRGVRMPDGTVVTGRQNVLSAMGEKAYGFVEFLLRAGPYDRLRQRGYSPSQARHITFRTQFDYSQASKFEQQIATRVFPFWRWARNNVPRQIELVVSRPGGRAAQTTRMLAGVQRESGEGGYLPPWMRERMAIRTGGPPEAATFMTQAGLPLEDWSKAQFTGSRPAVGAMARKLGSEMHPLWQVPIEQFAGEGLWSGQKFKDMAGITGWPIPPTAQPVVDYLLTHSPFSRQLFEARRALDSKKAMAARVADLTTGLKFNTIDLPAQKAREMERVKRERLEARPEIRTHEILYLPKDQRAENPELQAEVDLLNLLIQNKKQFNRPRP